MRIYVLKNCLGSILLYCNKLYTPYTNIHLMYNEKNDMISRKYYILHIGGGIYV